MLMCRHLSAIVKVENRIYIFGGIGTCFLDDYLDIYSDEKNENAEYYDITKDKWYKIAPLPNLRYYCGATYYNGNIYIGGGQYGYSSKVY